MFQLSEMLSPRPERLWTLVKQCGVDNSAFESPILRRFFAIILHPDQLRLRAQHSHRAQASVFKEIVELNGVFPRNAPQKSTISFEPPTPRCRVGPPAHGYHSG